MSSEPKKKRKADPSEDIESGVKEVVEKNDSEDESSKSGEDSDNMDSDVSEDYEDIEDKPFTEEEIEISFSAYPPIAEDFNGIKCLLSQLWLKEKINVSELTQLLIDQSSVSTILKQEMSEEGDDESDADDDEDIYGITSVIPLEDYQQKDCIKQLQNTLISYLPKDNEIHKLLTNSDQRIGLIVNERFNNLSPKISLPLFQQLLNDMKIAEKDKQNKLHLNFESFLMVCKILKSKTTKELDVVYVNPEEEIFDDMCDHSFEYSVAKQCDSDVFDWKDDQKLLEPFRRVLILKNENMRKAINKLVEELK